MTSPILGGKQKSIRCSTQYESGHTDKTHPAPSKASLLHFRAAVIRKNIHASLNNYNVKVGTKQRSHDNFRLSGEVDLTSH